MSSIIDYSSCIGRQKTQQDGIDRLRIQSIAATLDISPEFNNGDRLPPLWHWILFNDIHLASELAEDGHACKGDFLPPIELPRRMWAGGRFKFLQPLIVGDTLKRISTIKDIKQKRGNSGALAFVTVEHDIRAEAGGHWVEEHDIVYREAAKAPWQEPAEAVIDNEVADWSKEILADSVLLFRYSALTFNGHRIHYDREYCQQQEGYPGLIVHGPLTATLLLELLREKLPRAIVKKFKFRALRPLFDHLPFSIHGRVEGGQILLWAKDSRQQRAMEAEAII